jgi:hypothetical protein
MGVWKMNGKLRNRLFLHAAAARHGVKCSTTGPPALKPKTFT